MFTDGSLSEILMKSSLARLVNMLLDVLRVRKLFHRRMWFLMSHLSCSWREVLITLFEEHIRKNLRHLRSLCSSSSGYNFFFFKCKEQMQNSATYSSKSPCTRSILLFFQTSSKFHLHRFSFFQLYMYIAPENTAS